MDSSDDWEDNFSTDEDLIRIQQKLDCLKAQSTGDHTSNTNKTSKAKSSSSLSDHMSQLTFDDNNSDTSSDVEGNSEKETPEDSTNGTKLGPEFSPINDKPAPANSIHRDGCQEVVPRHAHSQIDPQQPQDHGTIPFVAGIPPWARNSAFNEESGSNSSDQNLSENTSESSSSLSSISNSTSSDSSSSTTECQASSQSSSLSNPVRASTNKKMSSKLLREDSFKTPNSRSRHVANRGNPKEAVATLSHEAELTEEDFAIFFDEEATTDSLPHTPNSPQIEKSFSSQKETITNQDFTTPRKKPGGNDEHRLDDSGYVPVGILIDTVTRPDKDKETKPDRDPEIPYTLYRPPAYQPRTPPVLHAFDRKNRPVSSRRQTPVSALFEEPVISFWRGKYEQFNALQTEVSNALCHSDDHIVVSAPTGAGKTALFEMAIARFITVDLQQQSGHHKTNRRLSKHRKMVYMAPSRALCEERHDDWAHRLATLQLGIRVAMITGDIEPSTCYHDLVSAHLILTTPEKWDSISRKWSENFFLLASVKLCMIDEVHMLGDDSRGACLESVVTRMKSMQRAAQAIKVTKAQLLSSSYGYTTPQAVSSRMRYIAVSATLPNIKDVAEFLGANEAYAFDESFRPVPLTKHVIALGYVGKNEYRFWNSLDRHVPELINRFSDAKQTLIFCHTKRETEQLASLLIEQKLFGSKEAPKSSAPPGTVQHCLDNGVAYHHAGIQQSERHLVEQAFAKGGIRCLCATSTLAVGVNLPAHLVIVKGTKTWRGGGNGYQDIDKVSLLQMLGRAGRPGLDSSGIAVIMTDNQSKPTVEHLVQGLGSAESRLLRKLVDVINTEISQRVITDREGALRWIKTTFLFCRLRQEPAKYAMDNSLDSVDSYLQKLLNKAINDLTDAELVDNNTLEEIVPLPACHIMSQSMVPFDAMKSITTIPHDVPQCQLVKSLAKMETLHYNVRRHEKKFLNECHKEEPVRFKLEGPLSKVRVQEPWEKAFVLLQAFIGQKSFENFTMCQEMANIAENAQRILLAAQEFSVRGSRNGNVVLQCLRLRRSLHFRLWGETSGVLNQIDGVGQSVTNQLKFNGITTFQHVVTATEDTIEKATGKPKPFGRKIKALVTTVMESKLCVSGEVVFTRGMGMATEAICTLRRAANAVQTPSEKAAVTYTLLAYTDKPGTCVLFEEGITGPGTFQFTPPPKFKKLFVHLVGSLIGMDETIVLEGKGEVRSSSEVPKGMQGHPSQKRQQCAAKQPSLMTSSKSIRQRGVHPFDEVPPRAKGPARANQHLTQNSPSASKLKEIPQTELRHSSPNWNRPILERTSRWSHNVPKADTSPHPIQHMGRPLQSSCEKENTPSQRQRTIPGGPTDISRWRTPASSNLCDAQPLRTQPVPLVTPAEQVQHPIAQLPQSDTSCHIHSTATRKRQSPNVWNATRRKQQRNQQRAFVSRRDNPFAFFQHDPNDAETFLDGLSHATNEKSVIPPEALQNMPQQSVQCIPSSRPRYWGSYQRSKRNRSQFQERISNQELLRLKAAEATSYASDCIGSLSPSTLTYSATRNGAHDNSHTYHQTQRSTAGTFSEPLETLYSLPHSHAPHPSFIQVPPLPMRGRTYAIPECNGQYEWGYPGLVDASGVLGPWNGQMQSEQFYEPTRALYPPHWDPTAGSLISFPQQGEVGPVLDNELHYDLFGDSI